MNVLTAPKGSVNAEAIPLAGEMTRALGKVVADLEQHWNLTRDQALDRIHEDDPRTIERIRTAPPSQLTFVDLYTLGRHSPELAAQRWAEVMQTARNELKSGHRAASIVAPPAASSCWPKARLLAMRAELLDGWQPRNSVERLLVDTLMQVQCQWEHWLEVLTGRTTLQAFHESEEEARWRPPRVADGEAIEQAAAMVDRFHRIMLRTIRQLQNLRRNPPVVMVQNAGQVNVGQQQVNAVAGG
ncbi:MAG: hypothetical protein ACRELG_29040 [Gemmataceae bacterium]